MADEFSESFKLYKAKRDGYGVASQFDFSKDKKAVFIEMANQAGKMDTRGAAKFDWKNKISFKLDLADVGEVLSVLARRQNGVGTQKDGKHTGLYHQNQNGDSVLYFTARNDGGFYIGLSVRRDDTKRQLKHYISNGEAMVLETLLRRAIEVVHRWD